MMKDDLLSKIAARIEAAEQELKNNPSNARAAAMLEYLRGVHSDYSALSPRHPIFQSQ
jgi:hypothetical protein